VHAWTRVHGRPSATPRHPNAVERSAVVAHVCPRYFDVRTIIRFVHWLDLKNLDRIPEC